MIKTAIWGADQRNAGELIRILINHPDVDIVAVCAEGNKSRPLHLLHHGLIGEMKMIVTDSVHLEDIDVLYLCRPYQLPESLPENLKIIDLSSELEERKTINGKEIVFGLSEINRKPLVRGAKYSFIPTPLASVALISLAPIAYHLLLNGDIEIDVEIPQDLTSDEMIEKAVSQITETLPTIQKSFNSDIRIKEIKNSSSPRAMRMRILLDLPLPVSEIEQLYENIYDDHNFSFMVNAPVSIHEVEGTNKCLLHLSSPSEGKIMIEAIADPRMRGGAGEAVHVMNLLCGLYEKTGLALKAIQY